jgi:hypothetical protein
LKQRTGEPWKSAPDYARELSAQSGGLSINLLVADVARAVAFQRDVLGAAVAYADADFAALEGFGAKWCVHADHTYDNHPLSGFVKGLKGRGPGVEIRLRGCDPDAAEGRARALGYVVLAAAMDKPHGLREAYMLDADGYCWVPDILLTSDA